MKKFKCKEPENAWVDIEAEGPEQAAEIYAEEMCFDEDEVVVTVKGFGKYRVCAIVEFNAYKIRGK